MLVTGANCGYCVHGKNFLNKQGVTYSEVDHSRAPKLASRGVPVLVIHGEDGTIYEQIVGYDPKSWEKAINSVK